MTENTTATETPEWNQAAYDAALTQANAPAEPESSVLVVNNDADIPQDETDETPPEDETTDETTDEEESGEEQYEIIEIDGKKYEVPLTLKEAFLRQQDYTKKTQELAAHRAQLEAKARQMGEFQQATEQERQIDAGLAYVQAQIEQYKTVDWSAAIDQDPIGAQKAFMAYTDLQKHQQTLHQAKQTLYNARMTEIQKAQLEQRQAGVAELSRDIPGWGPDVAKEIADYATKTLGMKEQQVMTIIDPKIIKSIYYAMKGTAQLKKEEPKPKPKPTTTLSKGKVGGGGMNGSMSVDAWMKSRVKQVSR